jgi:mRNA interferase RelE/StbE
MMYRVELSENALKTFKKMDKQIATMIFAWISKNLEGCENPRIHGKGLVADKKGIWRYRVGDYRLLAHIFDDRLIICQ